MEFRASNCCLDVLFCIKKHWWAVFCGDSTDRLQQDLVDKCLHYLKTSYCPSSRTSNVQGTTFGFVVAESIC